MSRGPQRRCVGPNVFPVVHALKVDFRGSVVGGGQRGFKSLASRCHTKHAAPICDRGIADKLRPSVQGFHTSNSV